MANATFSVQTNLRLVVNDFVKVSATASPSNYAIGRVVSYTAGTGTLIISPIQSVGSGTFSAWTVELVGKSGTAGTSGSSGSSGASGSSASSGTHGTSGSSGSSGVSASSGTSATSGSSGSSGTSGTSGASAPNGGTGPTGAQGPQGAQGPRGAHGTSGSSGATGPQGPTGATGPQGPQGFAGATGPTGPPGPTGPTGTSASYNQDLNSGANVVFGDVYTSGDMYSGYRYYLPGDVYHGIAGSYGPTWFGFNFGWASNAGLGGAYFFATSSRETKTDIEPYTDNATDIVKSIDVVTWDLESNEHTQVEHIGFIAEDTPPELTGPEHNAMDITNTVGVILKSIQELSDRVTAIQNKNNNG
mgnify:CR=1 FL=1